MKAFVQKVLENYPRLLREKALFERHLEMRENQEMRDALVMLKIKLGVVESWFALLNVDERFAFRQALLFDQKSTSAYYEAALKWGWRLVKEGKSPWVLHEQALEKAASFSEKHKKAMEAIFDDEWHYGGIAHDE